MRVWKCCWSQGFKSQESKIPGFEMVEAGVLVTLAVMSPEPGGAGGDGEGVAMVGTEPRPG